MRQALLLLVLVALAAPLTATGDGTFRNHELGRRQSFLTRLRNWLEPAAEAKLPLAGSTRRGLWLGDGKLAVWGYDSAPVDRQRVETRPAGLAIVDTRDWKVDVVDPGAEQVALAGSTLFASAAGGGLKAYAPDGKLRYHAVEGEKVWLAATFGSRAFVVAPRRRVRVVDAATGRVLGTRRDVPRLLHRSFSGW